MNIVEKQINNVERLCKKHKVRNLYLFGSVLTDRFSDKSDIDMVVEFKRMPIRTYADNYFDLKFALQDTFSRDVDLLENQAIRNPILKRSIDRNKQLIYGKKKLMDY
ncbi:MAG: nucleotidyltransferase domain-containing protein [Prevotellaceae bacterium]|jgi:predicted nucleotidyltransferase|nr:nucleotidyltransferase domain-containing protein [Prevotellaceae bacterium]